MDKKDRLKLRSLAMNIVDSVIIGKDNITDNVVSQINDNLNAKELIKIKVSKGATIELEDCANEIAKLCSCEIVTTIGSKIVVYRLSTKEKVKHVL